MKKLSFEDLSAMAEAVAENTLLEQITGGIECDCHDESPLEPIEYPDRSWAVGF